MKRTCLLIKMLIIPMSDLTRHAESIPTITQLISHQDSVLLSGGGSWELVWNVGSISLLAPLFHLHISPWEWQRRYNHSQAGMLSASFLSHHNGLFCQQGNMQYTQYEADDHVLYVLTWAEHCLHGVPGDGLAVLCSLMEKGKHVNCFPTK